MTGKTVWTSQQLSDEAGYASPIAADVQGVHVIMTLTAQAGVGVRASDGKLMWRHTPVANGTANVATPVFSDNKVFYTSGYGVGGALLALTAQAGDVKAQQVYFTREMQNHHGGVVLVNGYLYGFNNSILTCLEFATGKMMWRDRSVGKGTLMYTDGHLYVQSENNVVGLVEATPTGYKEKGRFAIADGAIATPPSHGASGAPATASATGGRWIARSFSNAAGTRRYMLYVPSNHAGVAHASMPLVVMLHGCTQSPDDFAAGTRMNQLAEASRTKK